MRQAIFILLFIVLMFSTAQARTLTWELSGVTDETGWSSWQGKKVALVVYVNGTEIARFWDNPLDRTYDLGAWNPPKYFVLYGKLIYFDLPYPANPDAGLDTGLLNCDKKRKLRLLDDATTAEIKHNRVRGKGFVSFGPTR